MDPPKEKVAREWGLEKISGQRKSHHPKNSEGQGAKPKRKKFTVHKDTLKNRTRKGKEEEGGKHSPRRSYGPKKSNVSWAKMLSSDEADFPGLKRGYTTVKHGEGRGHKTSLRTGPGTSGCKKGCDLVGNSIRAEFSQKTRYKTDQQEAKTDY